jgi:hypothetical protein
VHPHIVALEVGWAAEGVLLYFTGAGILAWIVLLFHIPVPQVGVRKHITVRELTSVDPDEPC